MAASLGLKSISFARFSNVFHLPKSRSDREIKATLVDVSRDESRIVVVDLDHDVLTTIQTTQWESSFRWVDDVLNS